MDGQSFGQSLLDVAGMQNFTLLVDAVATPGEFVKHFLALSVN